MGTHSGRAPVLCQLLSFTPARFPPHLSTPANQPAHCGGSHLRSGEEPGTLLCSAPRLFPHSLSSEGATYFCILGAALDSCLGVQEGLPACSLVMGFALGASPEEVRNTAGLSRIQSWGQDCWPQLWLDNPQRASSLCSQPTYERL